MVKTFSSRGRGPKPPRINVLKAPREIRRRHFIKDAVRPGIVKAPDGTPCSLRGTLRGAPIFLLCGGPSTNELDLSQFYRPGVVVMAVNNSWLTVRPHFWVANDGPGKFVPWCWRDPGITKFVPEQMRGHNLMDRLEDGNFKPTEEKVEEQPNVYFFKRLSKFNSQTFWTEEEITWGNGPGQADDLGIKGSRATMLSGIKLCHFLGASTINVVGADFFIPPDDQTPAYAFGEIKEKSQIKNMRLQYRDLDKRLRAIYEEAKVHNMNLYNCTKNSDMRSWPRRAFSEAIEEAATPCTGSSDGRGWYSGRRGK